MIGTIILLVFLGLIVLIFLPKLALLSRWYHFFDGFQFSAQEFYQAVEQEVTARKVPDVQISRVTHAEKNILSAQREYLQIRHQEFIFEIGGANFGTGSFVSWWMYRSVSWLERKVTESNSKNKVFFEWMISKARHQTDKADMFKECISIAVKSAIETMTSGKGQRGLTELEYRPIGEAQQ